MAISPSILTAIGRSKLASATPEQQLRVAFLAVGDGGGYYPPVEENMTSLVREVWRGEVSQPIRDAGNASVLLFEAVIPANVGGFFIREVALFDDVGDMIGIGQVSLIEKVGSGGTSPITLTVRFRLALSNTEQVTLIYQDAPAISHQGLADRDQFGAHTAAAISYQPADGGERISVQAALASALAGAASVSLAGTLPGNKGTPNVLTISNFDVFSEYAAAVDQGTASIAGDEITVEVPTESEAEVVQLTVLRNGQPTVFNLPLSAAYIVAPTITSPVQGANDVDLAPVIQMSAFNVIPAGADIHVDTLVEISASPDFSSFVWQGGWVSGSKTSMPVDPGNLEPGVTYYVRARFIGDTLGMSGWSAVRTFSTRNQYVQAPTVTVQGAPNGVPETPLLTTTVFTVQNGSDTHASTDWVIRKQSDNSVVWQSLGNTVNKTSITVPAAVLQVGTAYIFSARHKAAILAPSAYGNALGTTLSEFFAFDDSSFGKPYGGGYYAGKIQQDDGVYALIVAPKSAQTQTTFGPGRQPTGGVTNGKDGYSNSVKMASDSGGFPAAQHCRSYAGGGFNDWYLPSVSELEMLYRALKPGTAANNTSSGANPDSIPPGSNYTASNPARTPLAAFQTGGTEAFDEQYYWSSSIHASSPAQAWRQNFNVGNQDYNSQSNSYRVRPVRRLKISN